MSRDLEIKDSRGVELEAEVTLQGEILIRVDDDPDVAAVILSRDEARRLLQWLSAILVAPQKDDSSDAAGERESK